MAGRDVGGNSMKQPTYLPMVGCDVGGNSKTKGC